MMVIVLATNIKTGTVKVRIRIMAWGCDKGRCSMVISDLKP